MDSRTSALDPSGEADEGQEETLPNGDTKEWGVMDGRNYVEVWRPLDVSSAPESWVAKKTEGGGMIVRIGKWAQGVTREGEEVYVFRARLDGGQWEDVFRLGGKEAFPSVGGVKEGWVAVNGGGGGKP